MPGILTTVDIEDLATEKAGRIKNALLDLVSAQQQLVSSTGGLAGGASSAASAMDVLAGGATKAKDSLTQLVVQQNAAKAAAVALASAPPPPPPPPGTLSGFEKLADQMIATVQRAQAMQETIRTLGGVFGMLATALQAGKAATEAEAAALQQLAQVAREAQVFTTEQAKALDALNAKIAAGIPLTEADVAAFQKLTHEFTRANAEALGLVSATQTLIDNERQLQQTTQQTVQAFQILASQLTAGVTVSQLQKDALTELAAAAQTLQGVSDEDKRALTELNDAIRTGTTVTPQMAAEIQRLNQAIADSVEGVQEEVSAIEELIRAEQQAMQVASQRAQAASILESQLQEGAEVTVTQAKALGELNKQIQESGNFTEKTKGTMEGLTYALDVGTKVSAQHRAALGHVAQATADAAKQTKTLNDSMIELRASTAVAATVMGALAGGTFALLKSAGDTAARVEVLGTVMSTVSANTNLSSLEMAAAEERIKRLGITTSGARQALLDFVQAELQMADAARIARAAQDLAVVANLDSSAAFDKLSAAIQTQQPRLLRQFGIMTGLSQIYGEYARSIGKSVRDLDQLDKKQAFVNKILEEGGKVAGTYEAAMGDVGKQMGSLARLTEEARLAIGEHLLPVMRLIVKGASDTLKWFTGLDDSTQKLVTGFLAAAAAGTTMLGVLAGAKWAGALTLITKMVDGIKGIRAAWMVANVAALAHGPAVASGAGVASVGRLSGAVTGLADAWKAANASAAIHGIGGTSLKSATEWVKALVTNLRMVSPAATQAAKSAGQIALPFEAAGTAAAASQGKIRSFFTLIGTGLTTILNLMKAHWVITLVAAIATAAGAFVAFGEKGKKTADTLREEYGKVLGKINEVKDAAEAAAKQGNLAVATGKLPGVSTGTGSAVDMRIATDAAVAFDKTMRRLKEAGQENIIVFDKLKGEWRVNADGMKAAQAEAEKLADTIRDETTEALQNVRDQLKDLRAELASVSQFTNQAAQSWSEGADKAHLIARAAYEAARSGKENYSVWSDLGTLFKNIIIVSWIALKDAIAAVWSWLMKLPELIGVVLQKLGELANMPIIREMGIAIRLLVRQFPDLGAALHGAAAGSEALRRSMDPEYVKAHKKELLDQIRALGLEESALAKIRAEMDRNTNAADNLVNSQADALRTLGIETGRVTKDSRDAMKTLLDAGAKDLVEFIRTADATLGQKLKIVPIGENVVDVAHIQKAVALVNDKLDDHQKKLEETRKKAEREARAHADAVKALLGLGENELKQARALNEALETIIKGGDAAAYHEFIAKNASAILKLGDAATLAAHGFEELAEAQQLAFEAEFAPMIMEQERALLQMQQDLNQGLIEAQRERINNQRQLEYEWGVERAGLIRENHRRIEDIEREMFERQVVAFMSAKDQAIYAEQERLRGVHRALQDEIRARQEALEAEKYAMEERHRLRVEEIRDMERQALLKQEILEQSAEMERRLAMEFGTAEEKQRAQRRYEIILEYSQKTRALITANTQLQIEEANKTLAGERRVWDQKKAIFDIFNQDARTAMARTAEESAIRVKQIQLEFDRFRNFGIEVFGNLAQAAISGFAQMIEGAQSWKDVMLGIWQSLKASVLKFIADIVAEWIKGMAKMAMAKMAGGMMPGGGAIGIGDILKGGMSLFGKGAAGAALPTTTVMTAGGPLTYQTGLSALPGTAVPVGAAGGTAGGGALAAFGAGSLAAGAGGLVGYGVGSQFSSRTAGGLAGAGSGAATGAMIGMMAGPIGAGVGAIIGGIAGFIGGVLGGGKEARAVEKARQAYIDSKGGIQRLREEAEKAGMSIDKMLSTKKGKEFEAEVKKIENGIAVVNQVLQFSAAHGGMENLREEAKRFGIDITNVLDAGGVSAEEMGRRIEELEKKLQLAKAKEAMKQTFSGMVDLSRQAQVLGFDMNQLWNAQSIEEFNAAQNHLNELLARQKKRMEGLSEAGAGLTNMIKGFELSIQRAFGAFGDKGNRLFEKIKEARERGDMTSGLDIAKREGFSAKELAEAQRLIGGLQKQFNTLGLVAAATFAGVIRETGDWVQAMAVVGPQLDELIALQKTWGFTADAAFAPLLAFRQVITDNEDIATSYSGITSVLRGLLDAGAMTQETFAALGTTAVENYNKLIERGVAADQAMMLAAPTLQTLWEAQQKYGLEVDEATQALINQGVEAGLVGERQLSINDKILDMLVRIGDALGADIPDAYRRMQDAANGAGDAAAGSAEEQRRAVEEARQRVIDLERELYVMEQQLNRGDYSGSFEDAEGAIEDMRRRVEEARSAFDDMRRAAEEAGRAAEDAGTHGAEGHSPTGIKQLVYRLQEANALFHDVEQSARSAGRRVEMDMATWQGAMVQPGVTAAQPEPATTVVVQQDVTVAPTLQSFDGTDARRVWESTLRPQVLRDLDDNNNQMAASIYRSTAKHRGQRYR